MWRFRLRSDVLHDISSHLPQFWLPISRFEASTSTHLTGFLPTSYKACATLNRAMERHAAVTWCWVVLIGLHGADLYPSPRLDGRHQHQWTR